MTNENNLSERFLDIKHRLFEKADADLNPMQRKAVYATEGPLLVFAGAGSGKTTVLVRRVAQIIRYGNAYNSTRVPRDLSLQTLEGYEALLELPAENIRPFLEEFREGQCPPWNMLAITFTNKAANEIKVRLEKMFGDAEMASQIWTGTFHSVCMRFIRMYPESFGVGSGVTIYDTEDSKKLLTSVMKDLDINDKQYTVKSVASVISRAKERLQTPEGYLNAVGSGFREKVYARIYSEYTHRLEKANALDFDDIIMKTVLAFKRDPALRDRIASKFRYICVDEYQDTNPAQFALCSALASAHGNLMAVGDDDQSIYKFRGATVENILGFEKSFPGASVIKLEQNYRSTANILNAANAVIERNRTRYGKHMWTESGDGSKLVLENVPSEDAEARRITDIVRDYVAEGKYKYRDFAILYRANAQSNAIERTFARSGLPYRVLGGMRFNDRKEIRDVVAYLQLISNHADNVRLNRIVNEPKRKIGAATMDAVASIAEEKGKSQFEVMASATSYAALERSADKLIEFCSVIENLTRIYREGCPLDAFISQVLDMTGYRQMLIDGGEAEKDHLDNVEEFISGAVEYMNNSDDATLEGFLEQNALVADVDKYDENADAVVMMTIHSAKGLEFPVTILPGMEEGIFPSLMSAMDETEVEEERRLAYVALTRAKKEVFIFHTDCRMLYGKTTYNKLSRFIADIPDNLIEKRGTEKRETHDVFTGEFNRPDAKSCFIRDRVNVGGAYASSSGKTRSGVPAGPDRAAGHADFFVRPSGKDMAQANYKEKP